MARRDADQPPRAGIRTRATPAAGATGTARAGPTRCPRRSRRPGPTAKRDDSRSWALAAHLSALLALFVALPFVGPLIVYLAQKDDPYVRRHAAEALNFNISFMIYAAVLGTVTVILLLIIVGLLLIPLLLALGLLWIVLICVAAVKAGQGEEYRYPLTIRFVR